MEVVVAAVLVSLELIKLFKKCVPALFFVFLWKV
jgi:hypothetical protein